MSHVFNPYQEWLGIAPHNPTPSYYELLGLRQLESDTARIDAAYQRQSAKVTPQLSGPQVADAQRLMGELAEARMTLLTPTAKRAYDAALATAAGAAMGTNAAVPGAAPPQPSVREVPVVPQPIAPQPVFAQPTPAAGYGQPLPASQPVQSFGAQSPASAMPTYGAAAAMPVYAGTQVYPGWQGQAVASTGPAAPGYFHPPSTAQSSVTEEPAMPAIRPRRARRRSSPAPAVAGLLLLVAALGGGWYYVKGHESQVVVASKDQSTGAAETTTVATAGHQSGQGKSDRRPHQAGGKSTSTNGEREGAMPKVQPPTVVAPPTLTPETPPTGNSQIGMEETEGEGYTPKTEAPEPEKAAPVTAEASKPEPDLPAPTKPAPEKPEEGPMPDANAGAEEAATLARLLKSARAALADRDLPKAQDLLAEATLEATAPAATTEVSRVELLASYLEMFWDAVRKTLPKIELEELEINGTMMAVVEVDENHLIVRAAGRNREYTLKTLPHDIAYYLANRWLAPDDPVRNLVLASFEIVDPKGDRNRARSFLEAAAAARLKAEPLLEELKLPRGN